MRHSLAFFVLIILGAILVLIGLVTGISSHQITYQHVGQGTIAHYISGSGTGYLQMSNSRSFYIVNENDFIPVVKGTNTFKDGDTISFMYQPGDTTDIDVSSNTGTHLVGTASKVVEITSFVNSPQEFKTNAYIQHPQGFDQNNWGIGGGLLVVGLLTIGGSFFLPKRKAKAIGLNAAPPSSIGMQPPVNQYQQPYHGAAQYPQQPGQYSAAGQYAPQQPGQYPPGQYPLSEQQSGYPQHPFPQRGQYKPTQRADPSN